MEAASQDMPRRTVRQSVGRGLLGRQCLHLLQDRRKLGATRLEVRVEEELRHPGVRVAPDIVADLRGGATERAAPGAERFGGQLEGSTDNARTAGGIAPGG